MACVGFARESPSKVISGKICMVRFPTSSGRLLKFEKHRSPGTFRNHFSVCTVQTASSSAAGEQPSSSPSPQCWSAAAQGENLGVPRAGQAPGAAEHAAALGSCAAQKKHHSEAKLRSEENKSYFTEHKCQSAPL